MPPVNHAAVSAGVIAVSVAVAAAIAVYESPELQRMANDLRRRIAIALHSFGDSISPQERENLFNRPEDAEGFLQSRGLGAGSEPGVDADDETRRRQREELMYWNSLLEEKNAKVDEEKGEALTDRPRTRGSSFDDFLRQDAQGEKGSFVFHSGSQVQDNEGLIRRRGEMARGTRSLGASQYTNPFADEYGIDDHVAFENSLVDPEKDEILSDIYSATDLGKDEPSLGATLSAPPVLAMPTLVDTEKLPSGSQHESQPQPSERELGPDEYMTAGQENTHDAYSSIQAWAQTSNTGFYSPLPVSPAAPLSEPELVSEGQLTPTDSASLAGSGEDIGDDAVSAVSGSQGGRYYDVVSDDEGMNTPASWTEVGSVVSEYDAAPVHA